MNTNPAPFDSSYASEFYKNFCAIIDQHRGDSLPVSAFKPDGAVPTGTTRFEKRAIGNTVPQ
ncbi:MAG: hypothetical protein MJ223_00335 [Mycoplasmoidaceae bacterium]|nr:hypothetical protein [Mycoplasmoidaceae bacterium]